MLTTTVSRIPDSDTGDAIVTGFKTFLTMFFASAGIGVVFALISALLLKHIDLRKHPSLEFGLMLVSIYCFQIENLFFNIFFFQVGIHLCTIRAGGRNTFVWHYGDFILRHCNVTLHPFQSVNGNTNYDATNNANTVIHR